MKRGSAAFLLIVSVSVAVAVTACGEADSSIPAAEPTAVPAAAVAVSEPTTAPMAAVAPSQPTAAPASAAVATPEPISAPAPTTAPATTAAAAATAAPPPPAPTVASAAPPATAAPPPPPPTAAPAVPAATVAPAPTAVVAATVAPPPSSPTETPVPPTATALPPTATAVPTPQPEAVSAEIVNFDNEDLTINVGTTVTWTNKGSVIHTTTAGAGSPSGEWDSGVLNTNQTFPFTFDEVGTFPYYCTVHPSSSMRATVTVVAAGAATVGGQAPTATPISGGAGAGGYGPGY